MPPHTLSIRTWVSLSNEQRNRFRSIFSIPRSSSTEVNDGVIISDGTTTKDLENLTIEKMQKYVGDESTDFHKLVDKTIAKVTDELLQEKLPKVETPIALTPPITETPKKKRGRPKKNATPQ